MDQALSIVIPTYNERDNLDLLLLGFERLGESWTTPFDIVIVDDDSPDGTARAAEALAAAHHVRLRVVSRKSKRGLGAATVEGLLNIETPLVCVMDADLSHPPSLIPRLVATLGAADGVIASRYVPGGRIADWPVGRRWISALATTLVRILLRPACHDPLSGFFLFRRTAIEPKDLTGFGNKPLLEILVRRRLRVREVPYEFRNRRNGESKLTLSGVVQFTRLVFRLRLRAPMNGEGATPPGSETFIASEGATNP